MSRCIIHIPNKLNSKMASASQIRPKKMIDAFKSIGCEVDVIEGTSKERATAIKRIKKNIDCGIKYDFMYAESSTMPTLLTDPKHLPLHPLLDFNFFKYIKKHDICIGLFYRDVYWKFPIYKDSVKGVKAAFATLMYQYDLRQYDKYLDILYMPTRDGFKYVEDDVREVVLDILPPGCVYKTIDTKQRNIDSITLLYVGGLGKQYQIDKVLEVVRDYPAYRLILCCRENEWLKVKGELEPLLADNIEVVHKSGDELNALYERADIGILLFQPDDYSQIKIAMPYKTFEYMGFGLPMIASADTAVGDYVEEQKIGWTIPYDNNSLRYLLSSLNSNRADISSKSKACVELAKNNRWEDRALKVKNDLVRE